MEYGDYALPATQNRDPTFYGLSASSPISPYITSLSPPPPRIPSKRIRSSTQNAQDSSTSVQSRPQASPPYTSRSLTSSQPKSSTEASRRLHNIGTPPISTINQHRPCLAHSRAPLPPLIPTCQVVLRPGNLLNTLNVSGMSLNILDQHYHNFTFTWPTLNDNAQTVLHLQNLQTGLRQLQQTSLQTILSESAVQPAPSHRNHRPFRALNSLKAICETRNNSFGQSGAQTEEDWLVDGPFGPQSTVTSSVGQGKPSPPQNETQRTDLHTESINLISIPDLPELSAFDAAMFAHFQNLDHDLEFESTFGWDIGGDSNTPSNAKESAEDPDKQTLTEDIENHILLDSSGEPVLLELFNP